MRSLYLRIYLTVVAALALFALVSGWLVQRHLEEQRVLLEGASRARLEAWGDLLERALPGAATPAAEQTAALRDWSQRLRLPMALDDARGQRIGNSESFVRRELDQPANAARLQSIRFDDGRLLWVPRPGAGTRPARRPRARPAPALAGPTQLARRGRPGGLVGGAVPGRGRRRLAGGAAPDAAPGSLEAGR